jgi:hypothetical protein
MVSALKNEGVRVFEKSGWRDHNRNHKGAWGPVNGIIIHHTAGADSKPGLNLVYNGRSDLPGPLAHAYLGKDGIITLTGNGRANHAGLGDGDVLKAVYEESSLPKPTRRDTDGNTYFYGIEIANLGNGKDLYPVVQYDAAVRWAAAICRAHGWTEKSVIGHKEWTNQKIDPSFSMTKFRADVKAQLAGTYKRTEKPAETQTASVLPGGPYPFEAWRSSADTIAPSIWTNVTLTNENYDIGEIITPGTTGFGATGVYSGVIYFEFSGVPEGDEIQVRLAEKNTTGALMKYTPIVEGVGTGGNTYFAYPFYGKLDSGRTLNIQILNTTPADVTLEMVKIDGQWWRA